MAISIFPIRKAASLAASFVFLCGVAVRADGAKVNISGDPVKKTNTASTLGAARTTEQTVARTIAGPTERSAVDAVRARPENLGLAARVSSTQGAEVAAKSEALIPGNPSSDTMMSQQGPVGAAPSNEIVSHDPISGAPPRSSNASEGVVPANTETPLPK